MAAILKIKQNNLDLVNICKFRLQNTRFSVSDRGERTRTRTRSARTSATCKTMKNHPRAPLSILLNRLLCRLCKIVLDNYEE